MKKPVFMSNDEGLAGYWQHCLMSGKTPKKVWSVRADDGRLVAWSTLKRSMVAFFAEKSITGWELRVEPPPVRLLH